MPPRHMAVAVAMALCGVTALLAVHAADVWTEETHFGDARLLPPAPDRLRELQRNPPPHHADLRMRQPQSLWRAYTRVVDTVTGTDAHGVVVDGIRSAQMSCSMCETLVALLQPALRANLTLDVILDIGVPICAAAEKKSGYPDCDASTCPALCRGLITEESVDVFSILIDTILQPAEFCYYVLGEGNSGCPTPQPPPAPSDWIPVPSNLSDHTGEVGPQRWPDTWNARTGAAATFVHITDLHVDLEYAPGSNATCFMPICCRTQFGPGNATHSAGDWGDYNCDPPVSLVESLFAHIAALDPAPDFILYTGDDPAHDIWEQSRAANLKSIDAISALFAQHFPSIPVFSAIGNHEAYPVNMFAGPPYDFWLTERVSSDWSYYLSPNAQRTLAYGGYFTERVRPGLRVISLNTNLYMNEDFWLAANHTDFSCQLNWLADVLRQTEALNEKALLIAHAVCNDWYTDFCVRYGALVTRYRHTIIGMFHGHTHITAYNIFADNSTGTPVPSHVAYMPGSVTMIYGVNPTLRVVQYDRSLPRPYIADDFFQYWTDVPTANTGAGPDWTTLRYSAKAAYALPDLSPASWRAFSDQILTNTTAYEQYVINYSRGAPMKGGAPGPRNLYCETISETGAAEHACNKAAAPLLPGELPAPVTTGAERPEFC